MPDIVSKEIRAQMMSGIRGKDTRPEIQFRSALHRKGFRFRVHCRWLPGCPDVCLPKHKVVAFVNGCFWHGHDCKLFRSPKTNTDFWRTKIEGNRRRDLASLEALNLSDWRVAVIWECALKGTGKIGVDEVVSQFTEWLHSAGSLIEFKGT